MSIMPVSSPWAPATGWSVKASMPAISQRKPSSVLRTSRFPWMRSTGASGCEPANAGWADRRSLILGLYFMVQDPSG